MLHRKTIAVCSVINIKHIHALYGQNAKVKPGGTQAKVPQPSLKSVSLSEEETGREKIRNHLRRITDACDNDLQYKLQYLVCDSLLNYVRLCFCSVLLSLQPRINILSILHRISAYKTSRQMPWCFYRSLHPKGAQLIFPTSSENPLWIWGVHLHCNVRATARFNNMDMEATSHMAPSARYLNVLKHC